MGTAPREQWSGRTAFVLATVASAVGLGNIWRFSYVAGENGGGAFLLAYFAAVAVLGLPLMLGEFALGRRARADIVSAYTFEMRRPALWAWAGWLAVVSALAILSYYAVIAGWAWRYFGTYLLGAEIGSGREAVADHFARFLASPHTVVWQLLVLALATAAVIAGVRRGIERVARIVMPLLAAIVIALAAYSLTLGGAREALAFLFAPDFAALARPQVWLAAFGQAFFSLGVGVGTLATYGSYAPGEARLARSALLVAGLDTSFALTAGLAIFAGVFAFGLDPAQGPALAFVTLPQVFAVMPGGAWVGLAFFALLAFAALSPTIALIEVPVTALMKARAWSRRRTALTVSGVAFVAGLPSALSDGALAALRPFDVGVLEAIDRFASNLLLPAGALCVALAVGWAWPRAHAIEAATLAPGPHATAWRALLRIVVPAVLAAVFAGSVLLG
ncbi:MAG: transporter [Pseudomonadota bacterium]|jgi:NSS family neurotransmitter:Na+ symporter